MRAPGARPKNCLPVSERELFRECSGVIGALCYPKAVGELRALSVSDVG